MRLAVSVTMDVTGRPTSFGWAATRVVMADATDRAGVELM